MMRPTFAIINCANLKYNFINIKKRVKKSKIMAIVKADAYGHGMLKVAEELNSLENKPDYFGVAIAEEAIELRKKKIHQPILLLSPVFKDYAEEILKYKILPTVFNDEHISLLKNYGKEKKIKVHIKIDTGMGRLGIIYKEAVEFIKKVSNDKNILIDGIYTHFATSDEKDKSYANLQLEKFNSIIYELKKSGVNYGLAHAANSGAILDMPESFFDMVRPGLTIYGYYPSLETSESIKLKPVMSLVSKVTNVKDIFPGESVSYGRKYIADKKTKIAVTALGYADGFMRELSNQSNAIINGKIYRQVGQVCMDMTMFEVDENVKVGDKVILIGKEKNNQITAWNWAKILNTIPYEITCSISKRVPRIYI